jgi:hypothetical protein
MFRSIFDKVEQKVSKENQILGLTSQCNTTKDTGEKKGLGFTDSIHDIHESYILRSTTRRCYSMGCHENLPHPMGCLLNTMDTNALPYKNDALSLQQDQSNYSDQ